MFNTLFFNMNNNSLNDACNILIWNVSHILAFVLEKFGFLSVIKCPLCRSLFWHDCKHHSYEGRKGKGRDRKILGSLRASWSGHCWETPKSMGNCLKKQMKVPQDQHLKLSLPSTYLPYAMRMCIQQEASSRKLRYHIFFVAPISVHVNSYITDRSQIAYQIISLIFFLGELPHKK